MSRTFTLATGHDSLLRHCLMLKHHGFLWWDDTHARTGSWHFCLRSLFFWARLLGYPSFLRSQPLMIAQRVVVLWPSGRAVAPGGRAVRVRRRRERPVDKRGVDTPSTLAPVIYIWRYPDRYIYIYIFISPALCWRPLLWSQTLKRCWQSGVDTPTMVDVQQCAGPSSALAMMTVMLYLCITFGIYMCVHIYMDYPSSYHPNPNFLGGGWHA